MREEKTPTTQIQQSHTADHPDVSRGTSRRTLMTGAGIAAASVATVGALAGCSAEDQKNTEASGKSAVKDSYSFFGEHQSGISTDAQDRMYFAALTLKTTSKDEIKKLFKEWSEASRKLMAGEIVGEDSSYEAPPKDTGEAMDLSAGHLTITFGLGRSFFVDSEGKDTYGFKDKLPPALVDIPKMAGDVIEPERSGGDLCIQACADDPQVAFHAIRNLVRIAAGRAVVAWSQLGFGRTASTSSTQDTPRNLFGFKDGTNNIKVQNPELLEKHVWASKSNSEGHPDWMDGGTYLAARRIRMIIETWDRSRLREQEEIVGRTKVTGAPLSGGEEFTAPDFNMKGKYGPIIPDDSHMRLMHPDQNNGVQMLRRGYNYTDGSDGLGHLDAGLFFIAFICDPRTHFIPLLSTMTASDAMSEYLRHTGSAVFAIPAGVKDENDFIASKLFN